MIYWEPDDKSKLKEGQTEIRKMKRVKSLAELNDMACEEFPKMLSEWTLKFTLRNAGANTGKKISSEKKFYDAASPLIGKSGLNKLEIDVTQVEIDPTKVLVASDDYDGVSAEMYAVLPPEVKAFLEDRH